MKVAKQDCGPGHIWDPKAGKCIPLSKSPGPSVLTKKKKKKSDFPNVYGHRG